MHMKQLWILLLAVIFSFSSVNVTKASSNINTIGNSSGNIMNGGTVTKQGDWIYYSDFNAGVQTIHKVKTDLTKDTNLKLEHALELNVVGDWIYYNADKERGLLYKVKTDGTKRTSLKVHGEQFQVVGNWIYFHNLDDHWKLYKISVDGRTKVKLNNDYTAVPNVEGNYIYYVNQGDHDNIYKVRNDGKYRTRLMNDKKTITDMVVYNGWIYYATNTTLYRMSLDGKKKVVVVNDFVGSFNVIGNSIFYMHLNPDHDRALYRIGVDGKGKKILDDSITTMYNIVDGWIYYYSAKDPLFEDDAMYRMRLDGTNKQLFLKERARPPQQSTVPINIPKEPVLYIDNVLQSVAPNNNNGVIYLPVNIIAKKMGYSYEYSSTYDYGVIEGIHKIELRVGKDTITIDGETKPLSDQKFTNGDFTYFAKAKSINDVLFVPYDFFSKYLGVTVKIETVNNQKKVYVKTTK